MPEARIICVLFFLLPYFSWGQKVIHWPVLQGLVLEEPVSIDDWPAGTFPESAQMLAGELIQIDGYLIPLDQTDFLFVLSQFPFSACFFCDAAGPETVIELWIRPQTLKHYRMDQRVSVQGTLRLNADAPDHLYYILEKAEIKRK